MQLLSLQQKLKNEEEEQEVIARINRLNDMRGVPKMKEGGVVSGGSGGGGGTGLINTLKKLKGKKKKQRNLTAPVISSQDLKAAMTDDSSSPSALSPLKEDGPEGKDEGKVKARAGKKQKKDTLKRKSLSVVAMGSGEIVYRNDTAATLEQGPESPSVPDENALSQRSNPAAQAAQSQSDSHLSLADDEAIPPPPPSGSSPGSKSRSSDIIVLEPLDLSQISGKHSGASLSQPETFTGNEDHFSTQSSSDIPVSSTLLEPHHQSIDNSSTVWEGSDVIKEEEDIGYIGLMPYLQGSSKLYKDFGNKQHKMNLERVVAFLESSGEMEPVDLRHLQDWDGWMVASREIM